MELARIFSLSTSAVYGGSHTFCRVMTTPQGTGAPMNLCPETETDPMGFLKDTRGAFLMNGICGCAATPQQLQVRDEASAGSQYA